MIKYSIFFRSIIVQRKTRLRLIIFRRNEFYFENFIRTILGDMEDFSKEKNGKNAHWDQGTLWKFLWFKFKLSLNTNNCRRLWRKKIPKAFFNMIKFLLVEKLKDLNKLIILDCYFFRNPRLTRSIQCSRLSFQGGSHHLNMGFSDKFEHIFKEISRKSRREREFSFFQFWKFENFLWYFQIKIFAYRLFKL